MAMLIASTVLKSGGETYRADECVEKILSANGAHDVQVFSTPTGICVSAYFDEVVVSRTASVSERGVDLSCLDECLAVSRLLTEGKISLGEAKKRVLNERNKKVNILYTATMACICGAFFSLIVGGGWLEFLCSLLSGFFGMSLYYWLGKRNISFFITNLSGMRLGFTTSEPVLKLRSRAYRKGINMQRDTPTNAAYLATFIGTVSDKNLYL